MRYNTCSCVLLCATSVLSVGYANPECVLEATPNLPLPQYPTLIFSFPATACLPACYPLATRLLPRSETQWLHRLHRLHRFLQVFFLFSHFSLIPLLIFIFSRESMQPMQSMQPPLCFEPKFDRRVKNQSMQEVCNGVPNLCNWIPPASVSNGWSKRAQRVQLHRLGGCLHRLGRVLA
jgi:hypothetical protein